MFNPFLSFKFTTQIPTFSAYVCFIINLYNNYVLAKKEKEKEKLSIRYISIQQYYYTFSFSTEKLILLFI